MGDGAGLALPIQLEATARRIRERTGVDVLTIPMDLTDDGAAAKLFAHVEQAGLHIDILVNNAGVGMTGAFAKEDQQRMTQMLRLNMLVLSELTRHFLPPMLERVLAFLGELPPRAIAFEVFAFLSQKTDAS